MVRYSPSPDTGPIRQGEILSNVVELRLDPLCFRTETEPLIQQIVHPFAVVLTQDCDLEWDHKCRFVSDPSCQGRLALKLVPNILLCQAESAHTLRAHQSIKSDIWRRITSNTDERYHVLEEVPAELDRLRTGIPSLALDFKRVFTVPTDELYHRLGFEAERRCYLIPPFVQFLSSRFTYFLGRVAVPEPEEPAAVAPPALPPSSA